MKQERYMHAFEIMPYTCYINLSVIFCNLSFIFILNIIFLPLYTVKSSSSQISFFRWLSQKK